MPVDLILPVRGRVNVLYGENVVSTSSILSHRKEEQASEVVRSTFWYHCSSELSYI
jgi:hypothetical protein